MADRLKKAMERINSINFNNINYVDCASHKILVQEFLRKATLVMNEFNITRSKMGYPHIKAYDLIGKDLDEDIWTTFPELEDIENTTVKYMCNYYLEWTILGEMGIFAAIKYADLYEPMIKLFERGGCHYIRKGELNVGISAFPLGFWRHHTVEKPYDISDAYLDQVDLKQDMEIAWRNEEGIEIDNYVEYARKRILSLKMLNEKCDKPSHMILVNEYLQRVALFARYYDLNLENPFFSVAEKLGYTSEISQEDSSQILKGVDHSLTKSTCMYYLELSILAEQQVFKARKYYNLYEPLIKLFERGGRIDIKDDEIIVGSKTISLSDWNFYANTQSPKDISTTHLNRVDLES